MADENVSVNVKGSILTIQVDLSKKIGPSASGKTIMIAKSGSGIKIPGHDGVTVNLNIYRKAEQ